MPNEQWEIHGPYREGAYTVHGPAGEKIFLEIEGETRESEKTKQLAELILRACSEVSAP